MGMGFMGLLNFAVACFDVLAWPVFAVCYPLCVSIQAIEANSISDTKKLITYWVSFSLILLFEYAFEKILEWLPSWDYIKLMVVFCLVMPQFNGSVYVYEHFVRPCLSVVDPHSVINLKDFLLNLLAEMDRDVKENGTDAVDNHIASNVHFVGSSRLSTHYIDLVSCSIFCNFVFTVLQVRCIEPDLPMAGDRAPAPHYPQENATAVEAGDKLPEIPASEQVQKQWICAICQVTVKSETDLNSHLQGRRHKDACELLYPKKQKPKSEAIPSSSRKKATVPSSTAAASVKELLENDLTCTLCNMKLKSEIAAQSHVYGKRHKAALEEQKAKVQAALEEQRAKVQAPLHCIVCNVSCTGQGNMDGHLAGRKHLARMLELKLLDSDGGCK